MFRRARRRLTLLYIALFALILIAFSVVFFLVIATILQPNFDLAPDVSDQAVDAAYRATLEQIGTALVVADVVVVALVGGAAWLLSARTLRPIREAHDRQRRFVADASHEMRSPLAVIRSAADAALTGEADPEELRRALGVVSDASAHLARVSGDLLVLARSDDGLVEPRRDPVDVSVIVAEVVEADQVARGAGRRTALDLAPDLVVLGDADEIGRIVANLLDNAYRYGGAGVHVRVSTHGTARTAVVEVRDDGPGIAQADQERIFEPFRRGRSDATASDGSGLGLAIAASLARRHGGTLTVESRPGAGSTFRLSLPRFT